MALVILEGLDRTGKSTVANYFESIGFEKIHMSAPTKGTTSDQYLQEIIDLISLASNRDMVLDRSHYGELVWPQIFGTPQKPRKSLLSEEDFDAIREIEASVGTQRLWMTDDDLKAHWQRCVDNNEPLDRAQFTRARGLFSSMAADYNFEKVTLQTFIKQFPDAQVFVTASAAQKLEEKTMTLETPETKSQESETVSKHSSKSPEQHKLEVANVINEILSKRLLKSKSSVYDDIENEIRHFLNAKLGKLLGGSSSNELTLTQEEIKFYKLMFKRANEKI